MQRPSETPLSVANGSNTHESHCGLLVPIAFSVSFGSANASDSMGDSDKLVNNGVNLINGDVDKFTEIYDRHFYLLLSFASQMLSSKHDAEDVVAEVFLRMWKMQTRFYTIENIKAYLLISCRNLCFDFLKKAQHSISTEPISAELTDSISIPDQILIKSEYDDWILKEIERLPEQCRKIIKLLVYEGKKTGEIAKMLNLAPKTVTNQIVTARKKLLPRLKALSAAVLSTIGLSLCNLLNPF